MHRSRRRTMTMTHHTNSRRQKRQKLWSILDYTKKDLSEFIIFYTSSLPLETAVFAVQVLRNIRETLCKIIATAEHGKRTAMRESSVWASRLGAWMRSREHRQSSVDHCRRNRGKPNTINGLRDVVTGPFDNVSALLARGRRHLIPCASMTCEKDAAQVASKVATGCGQ